MSIPNEEWDGYEQPPPITNSEQIDMLTHEITNIINRYRHEFDLASETIVGILEFIKTDFMDGTTIFFEIDE